MSSIGKFIRRTDVMVGVSMFLLGAVIAGIVAVIVYLEMVK